MKKHLYFYVLSSLRRDETRRDETRQDAFAKLLRKGSLAMVVLFTVFFSQCTKDNSPIPNQEPVQAAFDQSITSTSQIKDFLAMVHNNATLDIRTTYTLDETMQYCEDGIIYEYSHIDKLGKTPMVAIDSITISFSGKPLSATDVANTYDSIVAKTSVMASTLNSDSLWLLGVELTAPTSTTTSAKVYIVGLFTDGTAFSTSTPAVPTAGLFWSYTGTCADPSSSTDGAATYIRKYVQSYNPTPSTVGKRIGHLYFFQMERNNVPGYSQHLLDNCTTLNPNDSITGDGNSDTRSLFYSCSGDCDLDANIDAVECISYDGYNSGDLAYHRTQIKSIFSEERLYRSNQYLTAIHITPGSGTNNLGRIWYLSGISFSLYTDEDPNPNPGNIL